MDIDVTHVAKLANIPLSEEEKRTFDKQLPSILSFFERLKQVDTREIPSSGPIAYEYSAREDEPAMSLSREDVLRNSENRRDNFIAVQGIFEEE